ncbi:MAG: triose-phosphate isomerase [Candidatus Paceibacterota bacterium]|jgi:triosephosphate isomerase
MAKTKLIVANWKMNPDTEVEAKNALTKIKKGLKKEKKTNVVICPPFVFINLVKKAIVDENVLLGAQDVFIGKGNSHTGEVGINMLQELGVRYIILGHSERKAEGETEEMIAKKLSGVIRKGLKGILCIGEKDRNEHGDYYHEIKKQLHSMLDGIPKKSANKIIIAYEPIWAIGKLEDEAINPEKLNEMTIFIRKTLSDIFGRDEAEKILVLYGGSVGKSNAKKLVDEGKVDGLLIGRDSLKPKNFLEIVKEIK